MTRSFASARYDEMSPPLCGREGIFFKGKLSTPGRARAGVRAVSS